MRPPVLTDGRARFVVLARHAESQTLTRPVSHRNVPHMDTEPLLTLQEVADRLRVSTRTVHRYIKAGRLTVLRTPGGLLRFRAVDVDAALVETAA